MDNLVKSGKLLVPGGRRDMGPPMAGGRPYNEQGVLDGISECAKTDISKRCMAVWANAIPWTLTPRDRTQHPTCKTFTLLSAIPAVKTMRIKWSRPSVAWLPSENVSCAITTKNNSTIEVGVQVLQKSDADPSPRCSRRNVLQQVRSIAEPERNE